MQVQTKSVKEGKEMSPIQRKVMVNTPITSGNYTWPRPSSTVKKQVHFTVDEVEAEDRHRRIEQNCSNVMLLLSQKLLLTWCEKSVTVAKWTIQVKNITMCVFL